jgi:hypothetical protein
VQRAGYAQIVDELSLAGDEPWVLTPPYPLSDHVRHGGAAYWPRCGRVSWSTHSQVTG